MLNESETHIYFTDYYRTLFRYNLLEGEKEILLNEVINFSVSEDEKMIIYENREEQALFLYQTESGTNEKLSDLNIPDSTIRISEDNRYLLYTDRKEAFVSTNYKPEIYVFDLETGGSLFIE